MPEHAAPVTAGTRIGRRSRPWWSRVGRTLGRNHDLTFGLVVAVLLALVLLFPDAIVRHAADDIDPSRSLNAPSAEHWFGTDEIGRDVFARVLWGSRVTLGMVSLALAIPAVLGLLLGLVAGYFRGVVDQVLSRAVDLILSFPSMITAVIITGIFGPGITNGVFALALVYVPMFYRVARSSTFSEASLTYVEAARSVGTTQPSTLFRHIARNVITPVLIQFTVLFPAAIQIAAALGYLGLGVQPPTPEWGAMLNQGKNYLFNAPWISVFPGLAIVVAALSLTLLSRGLQRVFDPRSR